MTGTPFHDKILRIFLRRGDFLTKLYTHPRRKRRSFTGGNSKTNEDNSLNLQISVACVLNLRRPELSVCLSELLTWWREPTKPFFASVSSTLLYSLTQRARRGISMPRGKNCRETIFAAQLPRNYPHRRGNFERGQIVLSCGEEAIWEAF